MRRRVQSVFQPTSTNRSLRSSRLAAVAGIPRLQTRSMVLASSWEAPDLRTPVATPGESETLPYVRAEPDGYPVGMPRPLAFGARGAIGLIGGVAIAVSVFLALVPGPIDPGRQTIRRAGLTFAIPAATNYTPPNASNGGQILFGGAGEVFIEFNLTYTSTIGRAMSALRPFNLTVGNEAYTELAACSVICAPPAGPPVGYSTAYASRSLDLGSLSLGLEGPNNQLPQGSWWIGLYNDGFSPDPVQVTGAITVTPVPWY
jgi:hypothetical protein